jgi:hypothetical protein
MSADEVFLFGATSMLGWSLLRAADRPVTAFCNGHTRNPPAGVERGIHLDDPLAMYELFAAERPGLIVHCAGVCDVEKCEQSPEFAYSVNVDGMQLLIDHAPPEARIVYCSSDHVFSGDTGPYDELSPTDPVSVYGKTRVAAERLLAARPNSLIVRAGLWIGPSATGRNGHLDWLRYRHGRQLPMTVVAGGRSSQGVGARARRRHGDPSPGRRSRGLTPRARPLPGRTPRDRRAARGPHATRPPHTAPRPRRARHALRRRARPAATAGDPRCVRSGPARLHDAPRRSSTSMTQLDEPATSRVTRL